GGSEICDLDSLVRYAAGGEPLTISGSQIVAFEDLPFSELLLPNHFYRCPVCGLNFSDKRNFRHHYMTHSGEKPYACHMCPYRARQKGTLKNHVLTRHG
ncbi:Zinc finger C2H2-type, partial [Trinorchestia longiramus]